MPPLSETSGSNRPQLGRALSDQRCAPCSPAAASASAACPPPPPPQCCCISSTAGAERSARRPAIPPGAAREDTQLVAETLTVAAQVGWLVPLASMGRVQAARTSADVFAAASASAAASSVAASTCAWSASMLAWQAALLCDSIRLAACSTAASMLGCCGKGHVTRGCSASCVGCMWAKAVTAARRPEPSAQMLGTTKGPRRGYELLRGCGGRLRSSSDGLVKLNYCATLDTAAPSRSRQPSLRRGPVSPAA